MNIEEKIDLILDLLNTGQSSRPEIFIANKKIDSLGRLTIPKSVRRELEIDEDTQLGIYRGDNEIIIKKVIN